MKKGQEFGFLYPEKPEDGRVWEKRHGMVQGSVQIWMHKRMALHCR